MKISVYQNGQELGANAARKGAEFIRKAIRNRGEAAIIVATGASQIEMLKALVSQPVDWSRVTAFHLDEYIGIPESHPASFRKYLKERFEGKVPLKAFHYINGENDPKMECQRVGDLIEQERIDVAFIGIGENGHLAFNDPPADFQTEEPYIRVRLDQACRRQQYGEGWFPTLEEVPETAISMSIQQIIKSDVIICTVPDERKALAVKNSVEGRVTSEVPASILRTHPNTFLFLDQESSSLLRRY